jgi:hypothetical protein
MIGAKFTTAYRSAQCSEGRGCGALSDRVCSRMASDTSNGSSLRLALTTFLFAMALTACGGSSTGSPPSVATTPPSVATTRPATTPSATGALGCPTAATVGSALGITLPAPAVVHGGGGTPLPAGATGVACEYRGQSQNVIIELIRNISPSYITRFSTRFPVRFTNVSGLGDQARSFSTPLGGGKDNEGVVATKGSTLVGIVATATPASLSQLESLVRQLL